MAGGTDFDTWNNDQQASSYDFGSPIGQVGDLRDAYYRCKRARIVCHQLCPGSFQFTVGRRRRWNQCHREWYSDHEP